MNIFKKEPLLIIFAGLVFVGLLYYILLVSPALSNQEKLRGLIREKKTQLARMEELRDEWRRFQEARAEAEESLSRRGRGFSPLSFMEGLTRKIGVSDRIAYMKPVSFASDAEGGQRREGIEIRLEGLDMKDLVALLAETEFSKKLLSIDRIKMDALSKGTERNLKVTLQVVTIAPAS